MKPVGKITTGYPALTRAEIDLSALAHNYRELRRVTAPSAGTMAVVKADAYGHGAYQVARVALECGAEFLAVARFDEAIQLRESGIAAPILLFGYSFPAYVDYMIENNIRASVNTLASARMLSKAAARTGKIIKAHIKIDTGMGRLGLPAAELAVESTDGDHLSDLLRDILSIVSLPHIDVEGVVERFICKRFFLFGGKYISDQ